MLYTAGNTFNTGDRVFLVEGEKDVDTLTSEDIGLYAASGPDGAGPGKWARADQEKLRDCHVCVIPDHDQVGRDYAVEVCNSLMDVTNEVKLLDLSKVWPEIPEHGDVTDMMAEFFLFFFWLLSLVASVFLRLFFICATIRIVMSIK